MLVESQDLYLALLFVFQRLIEQCSDYPVYGGEGFATACTSQDGNVIIAIGDSFKNF